LEASLILNLRGNLSSGLKKLGRTGSRNLRGLGRAAGLASKGFDRLGNRYTALATGAVGLGTARKIAQLQDQLAGLRVAANLSAEGAENLKRTMYDVANLPTVRLPVTQLLGAIKEVQDRSGVLVQTREEIETLGIAMRATGGNATVMGQLVANAKSNLGINTNNEMMTFLAALSEQGKIGKLRLEEIASVAPRITGAYSITGRAGAQAGKEAMALAQVARSNVQSAEESATAVKAIMDQLLDSSVRKKIKGLGIQIMDPDDPKRMRAVPSILKEVVAKAKGDAVKLRKLFTSQEAAPIINALARDFKSTGNFEMLDKLLAVKGKREALVKDAKTQAETMSGALNSLSNAWGKFGDAKLSGPIDDLAKAITDLDPEKLDKTMKAIGYGALAVGGLIVASKALRTASAAKSLFGGRGKKGAGAMLGGVAGGPMPVMVMNWPGGGVGSNGQYGEGRKVRSRGSVGRGAMGGGKGGGKLGRLARMGKMFSRFGSKIPGSAMFAKGGRMLGKLGGRAFAPLAALMYGPDLIGALADGDGKGAGRAAGGLGGGLGGAAVGAAIGSVVPGIGTLIGGIVGGIMGSLGGESLGELIGGKLEIEITGDTPVKVKRLESKNKNMAIDVDAGQIMMGAG